MKQLLEVTDMYRSRLPAVFLDVQNLMLGILCWGEGGEGSWEFLVGVGHAVSQILTLFPHLFSDQISKIHPCFHTWPLGRNYVIITYGRAQTKKILQIHFEFTYFPFLLWNNKLIHSYTPIVPSKTIPDSRPKWAKFIYTHSQIPWVPEVFLACGGNFRCWPKADTSSAVGWSHERRSSEKNLWHGAVLFTVPVDLCAFLSDYIYANQIESLQLWSCGPAREEVSKDPHYP